ncbi:DUF2513 domain-containing protein [uncultured Parvimonas sp.]|uniref:DUF2513 domain-containing protein n=1 Tax=uncultured Parvimonas sp. TaxID=747372 RepID=UPI002591F927|nr:DUF2513 domain-containing protein [uncultured Parvimonas sp.]
MKLNYDCVRDVMLYLEENLIFGNPIRDTNINLNYDIKEIRYSLLKLHEINYLDGSVSKYMDGDYSVITTDITFYGHKFIGEIQSDTIWDKTKSVSKDLGIQTINGITQIASSVISSLILSKFS